MTSPTTGALAVLLLSLGLAALALAYVTGRYSVRGAGRRAGSLSFLGVAALAGTVILLWGKDWSSVVDQLLWPLLVYVTAALAGAGMGAVLVYGLVAAR